MLTSDQVYAELTRYKNEKIARDAQQLIIDYQDKLVRHIRAGETTVPQSLSFAQFNSACVVDANATPVLHHYVYNTVFSITRFAAAAIAGGVRTEDAHDLATVLLDELALTEELEEIYNIFRLSVIMFSNQVHAAHADGKPYHVEMACAYIDENIHRNLSVREISEHVGLSPHTLSTLFSEYEGMLLKEYLQRKRVQAACDLLESSDAPLSEIAKECGFSSQSTFSAVFRKHQSMTPSQYRNSHHRFPQITDIISDSDVLLYEERKLKAAAEAKARAEAAAQAEAGASDAPSGMPDLEESSWWRNRAVSALGDDRESDAQDDFDDEYDEMLEEDSIL